MGIKNFKIKYIKEMPIWMKAGFIIFLMSVVIFANSLSNLGIIMRMKNMTMVYMLITVFGLLTENVLQTYIKKELRKKKKQQSLNK